MFLPQLRRFAQISFSLQRRGFYPKGGGKVDLEIKPEFSLADFDTFQAFWQHLQQQLLQQQLVINLVNRGKLLLVKGVSAASSDLQRANVAERQAKAARHLLQEKLGCDVDIATEYSESLSAGSVITVWAIFAAEGKEEVSEANPIMLGSSSLGERGKMAEAVGQEAAQLLIREVQSNAAVDRHLADQLIPLMALAGNSAIKASELTNHLLTNIYVVEQFLGKCFEADYEQRLVKTVF